MCLAIVRFAPGEAEPLVLGFNRDEDPARDAGSPEVFTWGGRRVLAAREPIHGGTWLGLNDAGLVVGLLNRKVPASSPRCGTPALGCARARSRGRLRHRVRSRGLLVLDCLRQGTVRAVQKGLGALAEPYEPFNLFALHARSAIAVHYEGGEAQVLPLSPGVHVFAHRDVDDLDEPKVAGAHAACRREAAGQPTDWVATFTACLCVHADDPTSEASPCRHGAGYRTLCSTILAIEGWRPLRGRLLHARGPPCRTPYRDLTPLIGELHPG